MLCEESRSISTMSKYNIATLNLEEVPLEILTTGQGRRGDKDAV